MKDVKNSKTLNILRGGEENADYKQQELVEYKDNPFIEALPNIFNEDDVIDKFTLFPIITSEDRAKPSNIRYHIIKRTKLFMQPLPTHVILERNLSTLIRQGYLARNPIRKTFLERLRILNELRTEVASDNIITKRMRQVKSTADMLALIGIPGIGKTTAIEGLLLMYPQIIKHVKYKGKYFTQTQIVWLKIDCSYDGSLATLCKRFFKTVDDLLGTRYLEKFGITNKVTSTMMLHMESIASMYGIGVLVIDEIQFLLNNNDEIERVLNFFVTLSNTVGIPTVLIGTSKAQRVLQGNLKTARRPRSLMWDRMLKDSVEWEFILETLWDIQCLQEKNELSNEIKDVFYDECQGITSVLVNLYIFSQERALSQGKEKLSIGIIRDTAKKDLYMIQPMIKALRNNDTEAIRKYEDISMNLDDIVINYKRDMELSGRVREEFKERKKSIELIRRSTVENIIFDLGSKDLFENLDDIAIKKICEKIINESNVKEEYSTLRMAVLKKAIEENEKEKCTNEIMKRVGTKNGIIYLYDKAIKDKMHPYDVFKKNGYIKNPIEEFL